MNLPNVVVVLIEMSGWWLPAVAWANIVGKIQDHVLIIMIKRQ